MSLPRVTEIMKTMRLGADFSRIDGQVLARASLRGTNVHAAIHSAAVGGMDHLFLTEEEQGYFEAAEKFNRETASKRLMSEVEVVSDRFGFIGHLDEIREEDQPDEIGIYDWKCVATLDLDSLLYQLVGGYKTATKEMIEKGKLPALAGKKITRAHGVQLKPNGTYSVSRNLLTHERTQRRVVEFHSACVLFNRWREMGIAA